MSVDHVVVVLLDSLNRHMLGSYGGTEFDTPNLDRFAARSVRFTRHYTGSLPCMPARHDILCGALDFLWKPWGSIELWEQSVTALLRGAGVVTMLVVGPSASVRDRRRELPHRLHRVGLRAWSRGRPVAHAPRPRWVGAPALPARRGAGSTSVRHLPHLFPRRARLPRPADHGGRGRLVARHGRSPRPVAALRRRVRPPRALRHARAVGRALRPRLGRRAALIWPPYDVGAVTRGAAQRARGPPDPGELRGEAVDDRPLVRAAGRRARRPGRSGTPPRSSCAPITATTSGRRTSGASRA